MNINKILDCLYNFILWMNKNVLEPLDIGNRVEIYIGITGILIAIVIFIAETINNNKIETQKRFIIEKTKMKNIMIFSILILSFCVIKELIPYNKGSCIDFIKVVFFILELIVNSCIIFSIYFTIKLFVISIKLNTNSDYFYIEYGKYINRRINVIHKKYINNTNKKLKKESIFKFVKDNDKYFSFELNNLEGYTPIKANRSGIFKMYSCRTLQTIIDKIEEKNRKNPELIIYYKPLFFLTLKGGEKINKGVIIAYCKNDMCCFEESIKNSVLFNDSIPFQDSEINLIMKDLYFLATNNMKNDFDSDNRLFNFYSYLYENDMRSLLNISYEHIRKVYMESYNNLHDNRELAIFLSLLSTLAYSNEDYERYKFIWDYIYWCYKEQLNLTKDIRQVSYDFSNTLTRYDYYSIKQNSDSKYYDVLLSNLMSFLFDLIEKKEFKAIDGLFHNVIFDYNEYIDEELNSYDILKMQFSFGFIYGIIILSKKDIFLESDKDNLKSLIDYIKSNFVDIYSQNEAIKYFKKYYYKSTKVQKIYNNFDFRFEEKKYRNSWSGINIDDIFILKEFIYIFDIKHSNSEIICSELISKDYNYFYKRFLDIVNSNEKSKLEKILNINFKKESLIKLLEEMIKKCEQEEIDYIKNNELDKNKTDKFKKIIFSEINKGNELTSYLKDSKKYQIINKKNKRLFGFNQIIGRELFFDDVYGLDNISKDYGQAILTGIAKEYLEKLDSISVVIKEDLIKYIDCLNKKEKYVIITSMSNWRILNPNNFDDKNIDINGRKIDLIKISKARDIYLIKKRDLPKVEMLNPDITESGLFQNGVYYNLIDFSTDESTRNEIQKNTKWLEEKGSVEEQIEYLKGNCVLKLFISPRIRKIPNSKCYKFVIKEGDE